MAPDPSEDKLLRNTSKERAQRIPLTYYRTPDPVDRTKLRLTLLAILLCGAWAAYGFVGSPTPHSPGPVASVHAVWDSQCAACHTPFEPLSADSIALFGGLSRHGVVQCTQCHAATAHHANLKGEEHACAACHHEHNGRTASLLAVAEANCTNCHSDVTAHAAVAAEVEQTKPYSAVSIRSFVDGHPDFKSLKRDPGKLKFSHARHMAVGQKLVGNDRELAKKLDDLPPKYREAYAKFAQGDDKVLALDCSACHQSDASFASSVSPGATASLPADGAFMQPVNFERHCSACHPLNYAPAGDVTGPTKSLPHGLGPQELDRVVRADIVERFFVDKPANLPTEEPSALGFPGKSDKIATAETSTWLAEHLPGAEQMVRARCLQCHEMDPEAKEQSPLKSPLAATSVPAVWFKNAKFDHGAHRAVACVGCHQGADAAWKQGTPTLDNERVLIPDRTNCVQCHTPHLATTGAAGVRHDCATCHRYHGSEKFEGIVRRPTQIPGADVNWSLMHLLQKP